MEVNADVSEFPEEQEAISGKDVTSGMSAFLDEQEDISTTFEPLVLLTEAKKWPKRSSPYSKVQHSKSKVKAAWKDKKEAFLPLPSSKKEHKRMQNKDAAKRYRKKRKANFEPVILLTKAKNEEKRSTLYSKVQQSKLKAVRKDEEEFITQVPSTMIDRKRMQGKDAAIRYKNKKKGEFDILFGELDTLLRENQALKHKVVLLSNEIQLISVLPSPHTPRDSTSECLIPDLVIPPSCKSVKSEPLSPGVITSTDVSPASDLEIVFTFVAPIIEPLPVTETDEMKANSNVSVFQEEQEVISETDVTPEVSVCLEEQDGISTTVEPVILLTKARKHKKWRTPFSEEKRPKSKVKTVWKNEEEEFIPVLSVKKERKRIQNKDAATRYRHKKKADSGFLFGGEDALVRENQALKNTAVLLSNEIIYLKGLMKEMFKERGVLE